jgi:hypothetical protein
MMNQPEPEKESWPIDELVFLLAIIAPILFTLYLVLTFNY